ncbi:MAG: hypothetical protein AAFY08_13070 [Planctomycetota bacterium]
MNWLKRQLLRSFNDRVGYKPQPMPEPRLWWSLRLPDGRLFAAGRNLPDSGMAFLLADGSAVPAKRLTRRDRWLGLSAAAVRRGRKQWQIFDPPPDALALALGDRAMVFDGSGRAFDRVIRLETIRDERVIEGGSVLVEDVDVKAGELRLHNCENVLLKDVTFNGVGGPGALEINGCRRVLSVNTTFNGTPGGVVIHDTPHWACHDLALIGTHFGDTMAGVNRSECVVIENESRAFERIIFDQSSHGTAGGFVVWDAFPMDVTISHSSLPDLYFAAGAEMVRWMFWSAEFHRVGVRDDGETKPWDQMLKDSGSYMFGLKHYAPRGGD